MNAMRAHETWLECERRLTSELRREHMFGLYRQAYRCLAFARIYQAQDHRNDEDPRTDGRIRACIEEVQKARTMVRAMRAAA